METAYVGVKLWAKAVNEAQSLEPKKIRRAMLTQHLEGPGGEVRIDPDTQHCLPHAADRARFSRTASSRWSGPRRRR